MKYRISIVLTFILLSCQLLAQQDSVKNWKIGGMTSLNISQLSFQNWAAGGENSINGNSLINLYANYKRANIAFDNTLDMGFGIMQQVENDEIIIRKTDDKFDFSSKFGYKASKRWYYSSLVGVKSQFIEGFANVTDTIRASNFAAPAYVNISVGMDFKPNDNFALFVSPVSGKLTFVLDTLLSNVGAYGVTAGEKMRTEFGGYIKIQYKTNIGKSLTYNTKLDLFSNYVENPQNIDVQWDNLLSFKLTNLFAANFQLLVLYDDDTKIDIDRDGDGEFDGKGTRTQFKQLFGIGITYKFSNS